ncbi:MAG TPA: hypothetical protein VNV66_01005, partial [Pilimelia sp.]|nr:hypothetical protein [Pilimelia sp.]
AHRVLPLATAVARRGGQWQDTVRADLGAAAAELSSGLGAAAELSSGCGAPAGDARAWWRTSPAALLWVAAALAGAAAAAAVRGGLHAPADRLGAAALLALVFVAAGAAAQRRARLRWESAQCVLTGRAERAAFEAAVADAERIQRCWPTLDQLADPVDPRAALARALWELALTLRGRGRLRGVVQALDRAAAPVPESDPLRAVLRSRIAGVRARLATVEADARHRLRQIRRLALVCQQHADRCVARARAAETVRAAETLLHEPPPAAAGPAEDLAERTEAVLLAYRELTADHSVY